MYHFKKYIVGRFTVYESRQKQGDEHRKRFTGNVTPQSQATLNLYTAGQFEFAIPAVNFTQVLEAGQTNRDLTIASFPTNEVTIERVLSETATRLCVSAAGAMTVATVDLTVGQSYPQAAVGMLVVISGIVVVDGLTNHPGVVREVFAGSSIQAQTAAKLAIVS